MKDLKITQVNEFEFEELSSQSSTISVKVGNTVSDVRFRKNYEGEIEVTLSNELRTIQEAVGELDFTELKAKFEKAVDKQIAAYEEHKKEERGERYDKYVNNLSLDVEGCELVFEDREKFVENNRNYGRNPNTYIEYDGEQYSTSYQDVGTGYSKNMKWTLDNKLTNYKRRNYASLENVANKIVELVAERKEQQKRKAQQEKEAEQKKQERTEELEELFGEIDVYEKWNSRKYGKGYYTTVYSIVRNDRKYKIEKDHSSEREGQYYFASLGSLTPEKINEILDILAE